MNRAAQGALLLLICGAWACQSEMNRPHAKTVQGCLTRSENAFVLTDSSGLKYNLQGNPASLGAQVGHEIVIRGNMVVSSQTPGAAPEAHGRVESQIDVSSVQSVADTCSSGR